MKNYAALVATFDRLGEVKDLSVQRNDQPGTTANPATAPAEISLQIYSPGKIVSDETGLAATIRRTLGQGAAALMWSARMIGVAIAFLAPGRSRSACSAGSSAGSPNAGAIVRYQLRVAHASRVLATVSHRRELFPQQIPP